jgi:hypothetical protein
VRGFASARGADARLRVRPLDSDFFAVDSDFFAVDSDFFAVGSDFFAVDFSA